MAIISHKAIYNYSEITSLQSRAVETRQLKMGEGRGIWKTIGDESSLDIFVSQFWRFFKFPANYKAYHYAYDECISFSKFHILMNIHKLVTVDI